MTKEIAKSNGGLTWFETWVDIIKEVFEFKIFDS